jgi:hypothetical protein
MVETNARSSGFTCLNPGISEASQQSRHFIPGEVNGMRKKSLYQLALFAHEYPFDWQDSRNPGKRQSEKLKLVAYFESGTAFPIIGPVTVWHTWGRYHLTQRVKYRLQTLLATMIIDNISP